MDYQRIVNKQRNGTNNMKFNTVTFSMIFSLGERLNRTIRSSLRKKSPVFQQDGIIPDGYDIRAFDRFQNVMKYPLYIPFLPWGQKLGYKEYNNKLILKLDRVEEESPGSIFYFPFLPYHNKPILKLDYVEEESPGSIFSEVLEYLQESYHPCSQCHYYSSNQYLRCAINPISAENREICDLFTEK